MAGVTRIILCALPMCRSPLGVPLCRTNMFQHVFVPDCSGAWQGAATASCQVTSRRNCFAALLSCRQPSGWQNTNLHPLRGDARGREAPCLTLLSMPPHYTTSLQGNV